MSQWPKTQLRRLFRVVNGGTPTADPINWDGEVRWATPVDLARVDSEFIDETERRLTVKGLRSGSRSVPSNSLILSTRAPIGYVAQTVREIAFNQGCRGLVPVVSMDIRYFRYQLSALRDDLKSLGAGSTFQELSAEALATMRLTNPDVETQQAIADFLDAETARIDALIAKKRRLARLIGVRYREERRTRMLRGLDPITGSSLNVPGWRVAQLGVLIGLQRGHDLPIDRRMDGNVPVISSGGPSGWHDEAAVIGPGVVTGRYGTVGEVYYVDGPYWPLNTTLYVHDFRGRDPKWVYHLLSVLPLDSDSAKSAVTGINRNVIGILRVPVPPLNEQRSLARELDAENARVNQIVSKLQRQIELLTEHRQALITAAVTGQIEIPGAAIP